MNFGLDIGVQQTTICDLWNSGMFQICSNCHGNAGGVAINHANPRTLHDSLVNVAGNSNLDLVSPRNPQGSYVYAKMLGMQAFFPGGGGGRMPQGGPFYSQVDLAPLPLDQQQRFSGVFALVGQGISALQVDVELCAQSSHSIVERSAGA